MIANAKKIINQYLLEKKTAVQFRQNKLQNWLFNENLYNGVVQKTLLTKSNLHVPKLFEGVHTMSSRLGEVPTIDYDTKPDNDENASEIMKNLIEYDMKRSQIDLLADHSKIECGLYGRSVFKLIPMPDGARFEVIDTLSFLISPLATRPANARYCGQQFIYKTFPELEDEAESFGYDKEVLQEVKDMVSDVFYSNSWEKSQRDLRLSYMGFSNITQLGEQVVEKTEWYTYLKVNKKGEYSKDGKATPYVLTVINDEKLLGMIPLSEVGLETFPFVSWATFPRLVTFWSPSIGDVLRDPNLAIDVTINQVIDNNTYRNFGMVFTASNSGLSQSSLVPRPLGVTKVTVPQGSKVQDMVWQFTPPEITSGISTYGLIANVADAAAGLSIPQAQTSKGGKSSVSQLMQQQAIIEQKTNMIRRNWLDCFEELGQLYADVVSKHLTTPRKLKIYGDMGQMTIKGVTKKNFEGTEFISKVIPEETIEANKAAKEKKIMEFYGMFKDDPVINQRELKDYAMKELNVDPTTRDKLLKQDLTPGEAEMAQVAPGQPQPGQQQGQPSNIPTNPTNQMESMVQGAVQPNVAR